MQPFQLLVYFQKGGVLMYPILLCSVVAVAVIIYKAWVFRGFRASVEELLAALDVRMSNEGKAAAAKASDNFKTPAAAVAKAGLELHSRRASDAREAMELVGAQQVNQLESFLPVLSTVANVAPLLGFLGTVTGMIKAFEAIARAGLGDPNVVASGIAEALITTASGLIVAIPCFLFYHYFVARVNAFALDMERTAIHVTALLSEREGVHGVEKPVEGRARGAAG